MESTENHTACKGGVGGEAASPAGLPKWLLKGNRRHRACQRGASASPALPLRSSLANFSQPLPQRHRAPSRDNGRPGPGPCSPPPHLGPGSGRLPAWRRRAPGAALWGAAGAARPVLSCPVAPPRSQRSPRPYRHLRRADVTRPTPGRGRGAGRRGRPPPGPAPGPGAVLEGGPGPASRCQEAFFRVYPSLCAQGTAVTPRASRQGAGASWPCGMTDSGASRSHS